MAARAIHVEVSLARDGGVGGLLGMKMDGKDKSQRKQREERTKPANSHDD
jgi:hypothetical protein